MYSLFPFQASLTLSMALLATCLMVAIDAKRDHVTHRVTHHGAPGQPISAQHHRLKEYFNNGGTNRTSATVVAQVAEITDLRPGMRSAVVLSSSSRQAINLLNQKHSQVEKQQPKLINLPPANSDTPELRPPTDINEDSSSRGRSTSVFTKTSSSSKSSSHRRRHKSKSRRQRRRKSRRLSRRKGKKLNRDARRRKQKLKGFSKFAFQLLSSNGDNKSEHASKSDTSSSSVLSSSSSSSSSTRRRKGKKNKKTSKNRKIVIAEQVPRLTPMKERCKTQPMQQEIRVEGCSSKLVMNNFCYGQCISVYIPEAQGTGRGQPSFVSCGFCRPKDIQHITVPLRCRGRGGWGVRWERRRVPFIKECRCMDQKVEI